MRGRDGKTTEAFTVSNRFRVTWDGARLTVACLIFMAAGASLIPRGRPVDVLVGVLAVLVFGCGGLLASSRFLSRRPVLVLDDRGVRRVAPWPRSPTDDSVLAWDDIVAVRACTRVLPRRGGHVALHYLAFVTHDDARRPFREPVPWEPDHTVRVHRTWDHTVEEVIAEVHRHRPELPFHDQRRPFPA